MNADGRIAEARGELERINAVAVHDAVEIDVTDVAFGGEFCLHLLERGIEQFVGAAPEHRRSHLARGWSDVTGEKFLVLEVYVERIDELLCVKERADSDLHTSHAALQLEIPDLFRKGFFVRLKDANHILSVILITDEQATLHISGRARRLDDVALRIFFHVGGRVVEIIEVAIGNDVDAFLFELLLTEGPIVLEPVRIRRASNYRIALRAQRLSLLALAECVVEHHDIGPLHFALPVAHFRHETVGDIALLLVLDTISDIVPFLGYLPGDVADEPGKRNEKKLALVTVH